MANLETTTATAAYTPAEPGKIPGLLVSLGSFPHDSLQMILANLTTAFPGQDVLVASPDATEITIPSEAIQLVPYTPPAPSPNCWVLSAADYLNTYRIAKEHQAATCLVLGADAQSLHPGALRELALAATRVDLAVACYDVGPRDGLVNSAILYPVSRAIYGAAPRYPLALDLGLSIRMAERLATAAQKFTAVNQNDALIWPIAEAASANFSITEIEVGTRIIPQPNSPDLNSLLAQITGSLFSDVELKASYWQRARGIQPPTTSFPPVTDTSMPDVQPMLDSFRIAYTNLHEIWSLVLPPNSLLGLKRLSQMPPASFRMPDALWARIVYDFILAWRLRTINRGHLLGALTPLYLAWVASHILLANSGTSPEAHIEAQAAAFEADKPYLVSRWRWPDRFNP
ncbi:hypothetical protein [Granulicella arctica]|uniref:hypothetical protein n=1 Tax=Granulicella arctica TaxID=940613 RepID=UPI0021E0F972|nr:hypothetical protein [Granulicella arctica]